MAIHISRENIIGGLLRAGSHVDVIVTEWQDSGNDVATVILQDVLVVHVRDRVGQNGDSAGDGMSSIKVFLAVTHRDEMILALDPWRGTLSLRLRSGE